jgi:pilus assembly protein Flp/PilA
MNSALQYFRRVWSREDGQDLIEYALLAALIALAAVVAMQATGTSVNDVFSTISGRLTSAVPAAS